MKSQFLSDSEPVVEETAAKTDTETKQDAIKEAKQYSNAEIPISAKIIGGIVAVVLISKLGKKRKK